MAALRTVYRYWAWLVFAAIVLQVGFAGYGAFFVAKETDKGTVDEDKFMDGFGLHAGFGYIVVLLGLILLLLALAGRVRGRRLGLTGLLFGLLIVQVLLAWFGFEVPAIGFFHPVNALVLAGLSSWLALTEWRGVGTIHDRPVATGGAVAP
ncbi:MAG: DUF6220 domain-containing protein [Gaiellaceae bacterium]